MLGENTKGTMFTTCRKMVIYQKCYDPDCSNYRSVSIYSFSTSEYKMNDKKRRSSSSFDDQAAFKKSSNHKLTEDVFVTPEMTKFVEVYLALYKSCQFRKKIQMSQLKARQHGVDKMMFLPSFLVGTASTMKKAKVNG